MLVQLPFLNGGFWSAATSTPWLILIIAVALILLVLSWIGNKRGSGEVIYVGKPVLSPWEQRVIQTLMDQLSDGLHLCPQVRLADIVKVESPDRSAWQGAFNGIASKSVDFVVMDLSNGNPILVIELDDRTHNRTDRQKRDALVNEVLSQACISLVRFKPSGKLDIRPHLSKELVLMRH